MTKLNGHWVAKRIGIVEHYKDMTVYEIALFDVYCLLSNKQTYCCYRTLDQLRNILSWNKRTIMNAKNGLMKIGFIEPRGQTGVYIPKLVVFENSAPDAISKPNSAPDAISKKTPIVHMTTPNSAPDAINSAPDAPIIEDDYIIDEKKHICEVEKQTSPDIVREIFDHWGKTMEHPKAKFASSRQQKIKARLKEGYTLEECKQAIQNCRDSPYHRGNNDGGIIYDSIELIFRNGEKLEWFINLKKNQRKVGLSI